MSTDIELVSKALAEFDAVAAGLAELRAKYSGVVYEVTSSDGMAEAKAARLAVREPRYEVERIRKAAKAPILAIGKRLDADAARITAELEKIEAPIDAQIKAEEARKEAERQAKIAAEEKRVRDIQARIAELRGNQVLTPASGATLIADHIADLEAIAVDDTFAEFREQADDAKAGGLARLRGLLDAALAHEAEQERLAAERAELVRLRAEQEARERAERERIAAEEREAKARRDAEAAEAAERLRLEREAQAREKARADEELRREREKIEAERRAQEQERQRIEAERAALERQKAEADKPPPDSTAKFVVEATPGGAVSTAPPGRALAGDRPSDAEIIEALALHFGVHEVKVIEWLAEMDLGAAFSEASPELA